MQWQIVGCSAIGTKHITGGTPCQDAVFYEMISDQIIIGAVSDGMGSARRSDVGSKLAVKTALSQIKNMMCWEHKPKNDEGARNIFRSVLEKVQAALKKEAENGGYSVEDLNCTLLAFVATPEWLAAMQVGDGLIVVRPKGQDYQLLFMPDKGEFCNETTPVTSSQALKEMEVCVKSGSYEFICAATDGIENISLVKPEKWKPFQGFFKPLEEQIMLSTKSLAHKKKEIDHFLNSEQINQKTDDDKTLLLCAYNDFTNAQNTVSYKNLQDPTSKTQQSRMPENVQPSTPDNKILKEEEIQDSINYEIGSITNSIVKKLAAYGITPEVKMEQSCLVCDLISERILNDRNRLSEIVRKAVVESKILRLTKIKKIEVYNFTKSDENYLWLKKINVGLLPNKFLEIAIVITIAAGMTLVFGFIKTFFAGSSSIIICFIFSLALISCIWFPRVRRD
ncbi:PP2C family serine/threonine-protein phosphatase [Microcoleus anatoxicus]|uniref:PP2C family serine/threonine-protein phosphatase n=1 Tax=Microcoleus anatoxicus PTRS2 TaxID=2705321 RepID=A0ABU8YNN0_9CYAN